MQVKILAIMENADPITFWLRNINLLGLGLNLTFNAIHMNQFQQPIRRASYVFTLKGHVLPSTLNTVSKSIQYVLVNIKHLKNRLFGLFSDIIIQIFDQKKKKMR